MPENGNGNGTESGGPSESHLKIIKAIKKTDVNALTPLEALNMLNAFAEELRDGTD